MYSLELCGLWQIYGFGDCPETLTIKSSTGQSVDLIIADHMLDEFFDTCEPSWKELGYGDPSVSSQNHTWICTKWLIVKSRQIIPAECTIGG